MPTDTQQRVYDLLGRMPAEGLSAAKQLFWTELNYERASEALSTRSWPDRAREVLDGSPVLLAQAGTAPDSFDVLYCRLSTGSPGRTFPLSIAAERLVVEQLIGDHPYALYLFSDPPERYWHLVNVRYDRDTAARRVYRRIAVGPQERLRTAAERVAMLDVAEITPDLFGVSPLALQQRHDEAFDVEAVTRRFFADYHQVFERVEAEIEGVLGAPARRLFTQRLFNRLLFCVFLERKGWLAFGGRRDYLVALWEAHRAESAADPQANFYRDRLALLFFAGLNTPQEADLVGINRGGFLGSRIGQVPYLDGGLFEEDGLDRDGRVVVPDGIWDEILGGLLYQYNFTVTESTPLDIEVAVDPEMLGKIFEELVTGRHESGSYYTPKSIVAFMGQQALLGYLHTACPDESERALAALVESRDAANLGDPEGVLGALRAIQVCDPACGSGAYLVGMLHELFDVRAALFSARRVDALNAYRRKLEIVQHNLYGVDVDPFAVNIARLRLWLSLIVEFEGERPPPLPNLDFKIEVGDSLSGPDPSGGLQPGLFRQQQVDQYFALRAAYLEAHGGEKQGLRAQIDALRAEIAAWAHPRGTERKGFDWAVEFAEVFAPQLAEATALGAMSAVVNTLPGQMELVAAREGGFVVLANPPYVRMELIKDLKPMLKQCYPSVYAGRADLYVYFYARALQLLRPGGMLVFISSNKFMRAGYGAKLRRLLAQKTALQAAIDFGDLQVFEATAYPAIVVTRRRAPGPGHAFRALAVDDMSAVERLPEAVRGEGWRQAQESLAAEGWTLQRPRVLALMERMRNVGMPLGRYVNTKFYMGVKTGLNQAFVIDGDTRESLIAQDPRNAEIIRPWLRGRDIKRWQVDDSGLYIIFAYHGIPIERYPSILAYLSSFRQELEGRATSQLHPWYELQQPQMGIYEEFEKPKIIYPDIAKRCEFAFDEQGFYGGNTMYFIPTNDLTLLGILNSRVVQFFYQQTSSMIQQNYLRFFTQYLEQIPVPAPTGAERAAIEALVRKLLDVHRQTGTVDLTGLGKPVRSTRQASSLAEVAAWERELDVLVYQVYGLTADEISLVEGEAKT